MKRLIFVIFYSLLLAQSSESFLNAGGLLSAASNTLFSLLNNIGHEVTKTLNQVDYEIKAAQETALNTIDEVSTSLLKITDDLLQQGLRLQELGKMFESRSYSHYRQNHQNIGLLKQLIPSIDFDSTLEIADPILHNAQAGLAKYLFQGDIFLTDNQIDTIALSFDEEDDEEEVEEQSKRKKRQITKMFRKWHHDLLNYFIEDEVDKQTRDAIVVALKYIEDRTCIRFQNNPTARNRVRVFAGPGCYASVGMVGGQQNLSLGTGCSVVGTVAHEFAHALGVWHTQMRDDRDSHVTIDLDAIQSTCRMNFAKLTSNEVFSLTPYEYGSFMHYAPNAFAHDDAITIIPNVSDYVYTMGNRMISFYDMQMLNLHYQCEKKCSSQPSAVCANFGYPNPNDCSKCICPLGYGGDLCDTLPDDHGRIFVATKDWQNFKMELGINSTELRDDFITLTHWITAPPNKRIQVKINNMYNSQCQISCPYNGIEIKRMDDIRITNPRICCSEYKNIIYSSDNNPTPVISFNRFSLSRFSVMYRFADPIIKHSHGRIAPEPAIRARRSNLFP